MAGWVVEEVALFLSRDAKSPLKLGSRELMYENPHKIAIVLSMWVFDHLLPRPQF